MNQNDSEPTEKKPGFFSIVLSVLGAAFGVQSEKRREKDFKHGKPGDYIAIGIVFVIVFIITLIIVVKTVISNATGG